MRPLIDMDTIQIEVTNICNNKCSNCTRLVGHHRYPYFMNIDTFKMAVDSMEKYPKMTGIMGGEPLLHPHFREMCEYLGSKIPPERCGLWSCFPKGGERYRDIIVQVFGQVFINDHTRADILHQPVMVDPNDTPLQPWLVRYYQHHCWVQNSWSACINPRGAFFCEIAGAISMLLKNGDGWPIVDGWWTRSPTDFALQISQYCSICGAALPLMRRNSIEVVDDISPSWFRKLEMLGSPKVRGGEYALHGGDIFEDSRKVATYKDQWYRKNIANKYGLFLTVNDRGFCTPHLRRNWRIDNNSMEGENRGKEEGIEQGKGKGDEGGTRENVVCTSVGAQDSADWM